MLKWLLPSSASGWAVPVLAVALALTAGAKSRLEKKVARLTRDNAALAEALDTARRSADALGAQAADLQALLAADRQAAADRAVIIRQARPEEEKREEGHGLDKASQARVLHHLDGSFDRLRP